MQNYFAIITSCPRAPESYEVVVRLLPVPKVIEKLEASPNYASLIIFVVKGIGVREHSQHTRPENLSLNTSP